MALLSRPRAAAQLGHRFAVTAAEAGERPPIPVMAPVFLVADNGADDAAAPMVILT